MTNDWHGVVLPPSVREPLEHLERAMHSARVDPAAPARRVLLWGAPGVGKTEIRRTLARNAGLHAIDVSRDDLVGRYVGSGLFAVKALFERARADEPTLVSIDTFEQLFRRRDHQPDDWQSFERVAAMLQELDDPRSRARVFIVGEINDPGLVDDALLKRGFELIKVPLPDEAGRAEILRQAFRKVPLAPGFDLDETVDAFAALLQGSPGRDLVDMVRRSMQRAADQAFDRGEEPADAALTRDLLLADETLRASSNQS